MENYLEKQRQKNIRNERNRKARDKRKQRKQFEDERYEDFVRDMWK